MPAILTEQIVLANKDALPAFPRVVLQILETIDDPDACLSLLTRQIETDAVIAARVLSLANRASNGTRRAGSDVFTALSLVGMARVREVALTVRLAGFLDEIFPLRTLEHFWSHSLACAVCGVEVAHYTPLEVSVEASLIACLLHDVGQLWLYRFEPEGMKAARRKSEIEGVEIDVAERALFGVDHGTVGRWLAESWGLSEAICKAIAYHHAPDGGLPEPLVAVVHISEVLSNALGLTHERQSRVSTISGPSCTRLEMEWDANSQSLFGRIEARSRHAFNPFAPGAAPEAD